MNTFTDMYGIMKIINPKLFTNQDNFIYRYLVLDYFGRPKKVNRLTAPELIRKISPWIVQKSKLELGMQKPIKIDTIAVPLTAEQASLLKKFEDAVERGEKTNLDINTYLRQLCNSSKLFELYKDIPFSQSTNKLAVVEQIVKDVVDKQKKNLLVFSFFVPVTEWLRDYFSKEYSVGILTGKNKKTCRYPKLLMCAKCKAYTNCQSVKRIVDDFNTGKTEILFGTDSMSRSHDLRTCNNMINYDLPWSGFDLTQRIGRMDRKSNPAESFNVYNVITEGTVEEKIIKNITNKEKEVVSVLPNFSVSFSNLAKTIRVKTDE